MSATLGDVTDLEADLTRRTGRPTSTVRSATRPVPLDWSFRLTPVLETIEDLIEHDQAPIYIVHFTQASAVERAQQLMSTNLCTREEKDRIAELIGDFRFSTGFGKTLSRFVRSGVGVHHAGPAPEVPPARGAPRPGRAAQGHLRHRHARRRHQRAHPHRAVHGAVQVRRHPHAPPERPGVPPDRRPGRAGRVRPRGIGGRPGPRARDRERRRRSPRPATTPRSAARSCARSRRRGSCRGARPPSSGSWPPSPSR